MSNGAVSQSTSAVECPGARRTGALRIKDDDYGFIREDGTETDYFVHISSLRDRSLWREGQRVSFLPGKPRHLKKAPPARDVAAAEERPAQRRRGPRKPSGRDLDIVEHEREIALQTSGKETQP